MLPRDKVIWSRECTPTMAVAAAPLHEKVRTKTAWILVLLVMGSMLMCRGPIYFVFSLINLSILTNHTVALANCCSSNRAGSNDAEMKK